MLAINDVLRAIVAVYNCLICIRTVFGFYHELCHILFIHAYS